MKKTIITLLIFLIFITLNFANLKDFYENYLGKISYEKGEFESAEKYFQNSENKKSIYNLAKTFYKQKKYKLSAEKFESLLDSEKNIFNFYVNSNLGNVYFKIGEAEKSKENWEKSIEFYREALKIKYDEKVEKNLHFVLDKLNDLKKEESKNSEKDSETSSPSMGQAEGQEKGSEGKNSESTSPSMEQAEGQEENTGSGKSEDKSGEQKNDSESSSPSMGQAEGKENEKYELTDEQKVELKKYQDNLKKSELQNSDSFGKVYTENDDFSNFDSIFNDPLFDDPFGKGKTEKKDW